MNSTTNWLVRTGVLIRLAGEGARADPLGAQVGAVLERGEARLLVDGQVAERLALFAESECEMAVVAVLLPLQISCHAILLKSLAER